MRGLFEIGFSWQGFAVVVAVSWALAYLVREVLRKRLSGSCASKSCGCEAKKLAAHAKDR